MRRLVPFCGAGPKPTELFKCSVLHLYACKKEKKEKKNDKLVLKYIGAIDDNAQDGKMAEAKYVENAMNQIIAGQPVKENMTKAVGCTIKWKKS